ncbi:hypothetical protein ACP70R_019310 [Stipagrostis hirtigluma subsp. patula]
MVRHTLPTMMYGKYSIPFVNGDALASLTVDGFSGVKTMVTGHITTLRALLVGIILEFLPAVSKLALREDDQLGLKGLLVESLVVLLQDRS